MNALVLAELFRAAFAADAVFAGRVCHNDQSAETLTRPSLIFMAATKSLNSTGSIFSYTLTISVEDSADRPQDTDPDPADVHAAAIAKVRAKLFGVPGYADSEVMVEEPTPRGELLMEALNAEEIFDLRGWDCADSDPGLETHHFRTAVGITGCGIQL